MKSNSNTNITNFTVDPITQQITSLEVNGETVGSADLDDNKTATINVSTYTEPVEVIPTSGKDGMKKATITLSNIPSGFDVTKLSFVQKTTPTGSQLTDTRVDGDVDISFLVELSYDGTTLGYIRTGSTHNEG